MKIIYNSPNNTGLIAGEVKELIFVPNKVRIELLSTNILLGEFVDEEDIPLRRFLTRCYLSDSPLDITKSSKEICFFNINTGEKLNIKLKKGKFRS